MYLKLFISILVINLFFGNICAGEIFNEILSDLLRVLIDPDANKVYTLRKDIIPNQWMTEIYKNAKIDAENGRGQFVGQFALRNFIRKIHSFAFSHIVDIGREGANRCKDYDEAAISEGFLNAFSENQGLKAKLEEFLEKNKISEFFELIYSFSIKSESLLEGIAIEGEKQRAKDKKLNILIEAHNCMAHNHHNQARIFSEKIVPNFENGGAEFNGIVIEWNNKDESDKITEREVNFRTFVEFKKKKLTPREWLKIARKFARNVFDDVVVVIDDHHSYHRDLYDDMLVQLIHGFRYINFDCARNYKAGIFGIGVMQKLLEDGNKNGYLAQFQGIRNEIQKAKNMVEKMFKRRYKQCTYEIDDNKTNYFNIFEAFLHYEDVIEIDWNEAKGQIDEIEDLHRMGPYMEYLQTNELNFKIEIAWIGRIYPFLKNPYNQLEEYYETDERDFYGVDLVRMFVEKFGIFAKSVPSQIEREFDLWHLVGKMDQELDDLEEWMTRDIFGTELMKKYVNQMEELKDKEDMLEFYENNEIQEIVENLKENIKKLDENREEIAALNAMQKNVLKFAEICKRLPEFEHQWYGIEKLVNNLNHEIGKFLKNSKDRKGKNEQKLVENRSEFEEFSRKMKDTMGKMAKKVNKKWAKFSKNKSNPEDGKGIKGMENIQKSFEILAKMKNTISI